MTWWCTMAEAKYRDEGGVQRIYCKWLARMVELDFCKKECTDRMPEKIVDSKQ
ncbi:MAG: hypothetical protein QMD05_09490 [Candidatus Brocadiaceae bacterium]|nr:hypothetical protein [Candidatus Brocadiaceae bacterium]